MSQITSPSVLITDFDGTITEHDFYILAVERLLSSDDLAPWGEYRAGKLTHFEALRQIFAHIRAPEAEVLDMVCAMNPDPLLKHYVEELRQAGWDVGIASAGCAWYIRYLLQKMDVEIEVHSNPGYYAGGGPLVFEEDTASPFYCKETGIDKAALVRFHQSRGATVAYAGDGYPDLDAALQVPPSLRFAKAALAEALTERQESFQPFSRWGDIVQMLLNK